MSAYRPIPHDPNVSAASASRRALLVGAAGGIAALAATAIGGMGRARASVGDPLLAGSVIGSGAQTSGVSNNSDTNGTWVVTQNGKGTAVRGSADKGTGGRFSTQARFKYGLVATNAAADPGDGAAIFADGGACTGIDARSTNGTALYAASTSGVGVYAYSGDDFALWSSNEAHFNSFLEMGTINDPAGGTSGGGSARVYARDNGSGKTQLCVRFNTGVVQILATEP